MTHVSTSPPRAPRFRGIDGLRGLAACGVAVYHFNESIARGAPHWLPDWLATLARHGFLGVDVFFVISGFVIAFSVRDGEYSGRYLGLFAIRRSIRLDPPYWFAIATELVLIVVSARLFPSLTTPFPSVPKILAHFIYAQDILGYGGILPIFWTLCYEIQFYLLFVGLLVLWHKAKPHVHAGSRRAIVWVVLATLFGLSLALRYGGLQPPVRGLALDRWFQFFLGVLTWWVVSGSLPAIVVGVPYAALLGMMIGFHTDAYQALPIIVSGFVILAARARRLDTALDNRVLQFLGKTSYSMYLLHGPIGERWISLLERLVGPSFGMVWAWIAFASAMAISVAVSAAVWQLIEAPTMRFSKKIRLPTREESRASTTMQDAGLATAGRGAGI